MINSKDIPKYLKENAKFCNWKYETRDGRLIRTDAIKVLQLN